MTTDQIRADKIRADHYPVSADDYSCLGTAVKNQCSCGHGNQWHYITLLNEAKEPRL